MSFPLGPGPTTVTGCTPAGPGDAGMFLTHTMAPLAGAFTLRGRAPGAVRVAVEPDLDDAVRLVAVRRARSPCPGGPDARGDRRAGFEVRDGRATRPRHRDLVGVDGRAAADRAAETNQQRALRGVVIADADVRECGEQLARWCTEPPGCRPRCRELRSRSRCRSTRLTVFHVLAGRPGGWVLLSRPWNAVFASVRS